MYEIVKKRALHETVTLMEVHAPAVARKARPGQFIILRIDEAGERIPLTIAGSDRVRGTITIIFQKVGYTTRRLDLLGEGDALLDFVGPLGTAWRACIAWRSSAAGWAWPSRIRRPGRCTRWARRWM